MKDKMSLKTLKLKGSEEVRDIHPNSPSMR
jgi:hypothetical protein